jgi:hypothetical protein
LDEGHRCRGLWRFYGRALGVAALGGVTLTYLIAERPVPAVVVIVALLGAVLVTAGWLASF